MTDRCLVGKEWYVRLAAQKTHQNPKLAFVRAFSSIFRFFLRFFLPQISLCLKYMFKSFFKQKICVSGQLWLTHLGWTTKARCFWFPASTEGSWARSRLISSFHNQNIMTLRFLLVIKFKSNIFLVCSRLYLTLYCYFCCCIGRNKMSDHLQNFKSKDMIRENAPCCGSYMRKWNTSWRFHKSEKKNKNSIRPLTPGCAV